MPDPQPPTHPTPNRRFVQSYIVQPFIQWVPLGGSGWLFVSFILQQEWLQVLLTFPITLVTAIWAAYSNSFIERFSAIYAEKGKQDADALNQWLQSLDAALKWQFSGFEAKYLKCQQLDCQEDHPDGIKHDDGIFTPLLQDVFVPLRLSADSVLGGYGQRSSARGKRDEDRVMLIWDLLRRVQQESAYQQIAILAWGGYGKTTLLKHIAYTYAAKRQGKYRVPKRVPFLLYLKDCWSAMKKLPADDPASLPKLLTEYHLPRLPQGKGLKVPPQWTRQLLDQGMALVMFDGFDEVWPRAERQAASQWISEQMRHYRAAVFMITSRPAAYKQDYTAKPPTASFWIEDFNADQRRRFVEQWYGCQERMARGGRNTPDVQQRAQQNAASLLAQLEARPELKAIAGNALLLNMMARFHRDKQGEQLPQRKVELYQEICELQLSRRPSAKRISLLLSDFTQRQTVLQQIALAMMQRTQGEEHGFKQIERDDILKLLSTALVEFDQEVSAADFLQQTVQVSELLVEKDGGVYEFSHLSFQEFLAAKEVIRLKQEPLFYDYFALDTWKPTLLFYVEMVNPASLIQAALRLDLPALAHQILRKKLKQVGLSAGISRDLESLKSTVIAAAIQPLERYLQAEQWRDADQETYRLMIITVGKDWGDFFEREDLLNFPCEELRLIDGLWVQYSGGKFGFSVQKQIYVACGGKLDGSYPELKIWYEFCDRIGWRSKEGKDYSDLKFSLNLSSTGELPVGPTYTRVSDAEVSFLAQRLVNCSISGLQSDPKS